MQSRTRYTIAITAVVVCILVLGIGLGVLVVGGPEAAERLGLESSRFEWMADVADFFTADSYTIAAISTPPNGGVVSSNTESFSGSLGSEVLLSAVAREGYVFDHWEGDAEGSLPLVSLTLDGDKTVKAVFRPVSVDWEPDDLSMLPRYEEGVQIWYRVWFTDMVGPYTATDGRTFMVLDMAIQNSDFTSFSTHALNFSVEYAGTRFSPAWYVLPDGLKARELRNRERLSGRLVFELPESAAEGGYLLRYEGAQEHSIDWIPSS
jgi:hypothetical protein